MKKTIFIIATSNTAIRPFVELVRQLSKKIDIEAIILCNKNIDCHAIANLYADVMQNIKFIELEKSGKNVIQQSIVVEKNKKDKQKKSFFYNCWLKIYSESAFVQSAIILKDSFKLALDYRKKEKKLEQYFEIYKPAALIIYADYRMGYEALGIKIANKRGIPSAIAPIVKISRPEQHIAQGGGCYKKYKYERFNYVEKWIIKHKPLSIVEVESLVAMRYAPYEVIAFLMMGIMPLNPWVFGTSKCTLAALKDIENYNYTIAVMGEKYRNKIKLVESIEDTDIKEKMKSRGELQARIREKYGLRDRIVCFATTAYAHSSLPVTYEMEKENHIKILKVLSENFDRILISLHPQLQYSEYTYMSEIENCVIIEEPFYQILPACDICIGLEVSSINETIQKLGIPHCFIKHDAFMRGLSDTDMEELHTQIQLAKNQTLTENIDTEQKSNSFSDIIVEMIANE